MSETREYNHFLSSSLSQLSQNISRGTNVMIETLFGDPNPLSRRSRATSNDVYTSVRARSKLPWAVIYSEHSGKVRIIIF